MDCCSVERFTRDENKITETNHWASYIRDPQVTLGSCIVALKRHCETMGEMTSEETEDFANITRLTENALKKAFGFEKINWLAMMMKDHHVHFHVYPRYSQAREFDGRTWIDADGIKPPNSKNAVALEKKELDVIKEKIKECTE